jgi:hypothetical protein
MNETNNLYRKREMWTVTLREINQIRFKNILVNIEYVNCVKRQELQRDEIFHFVDTLLVFVMKLRKALEGQFYKCLKTKFSEKNICT